MDSYDCEQTDREMLERLARPDGTGEFTRIFEPADYERAADFLYQASGKGTTVHALGASLTAKTLAEQFAWDYEGFDPGAFMVSCRTGKRYVPLVPDESDERARAEAEGVTDETYEDVCERIGLVTGPGGLDFYRYRVMSASAPEYRLTACERQES